MMIKEMAKKIFWLGHDSFRIDGAKRVYFDPYQISAGPKADLILISHDHFDHCSPDDVAKVQQPATVIITEKDSAKKLKGNVRVLKSGESVMVDEVKVEAVPSYNTDKEFHPKKKGWLGFVVELDGVRIYHAGDADFIPEMKDLKVDIALLPVSGTYVLPPGRKYPVLAGEKVPMVGRSGNTLRGYSSPLPVSFFKAHLFLI